MSKNKNRPIIVSFDGFHYQSFLTQATATIPAFSVIFIRVKFMIKIFRYFVSFSFIYLYLLAGPQEKWLFQYGNLI